MTSSARHAARGTVLYSAAQVALTLAGYVVAVVLARGLGPADFGGYGMIYSFLMVVELVALVGIPATVSRLIAERGDRERAIAASGFALVAITYSCAFAGLWLAAPLLADRFHIPDGAWLFRIAALDLPFYGVYFLGAHILNGRRDFAAESLGIFAYASAKIASILMLLFVGITIEGALIANAASSAVGLIAIALQVGRRSFGLSFEYARPIAQVAGVVAMGALGMQLLLHLDLWFVNAIDTAVTRETKGYYVAAKNIARMPIFVAFVMTAVLVPSISHARAKGDVASIRQIVQGTMRFLAVTLLPVCVLLVAGASPVMSLLFSEKYAAGAPLLGLLAVANGLFYPIFSSCLAILVAMGRQRVGAVIAVLSIPFNFIANELLEPQFGARGAAMAAVCVSLVAASTAAWQVYRACGVLLRPSVAGRVLAAAAVVFGIALWLPANDWLALVELAGLGVVFLLLCAILGVITKDDLTFFRKGAPAAKGAEMQQTV